jgi:hypothetical protein
MTVKRVGATFFGCISLFAASVYAQTPPATQFMDTFLKISAVDLREIDHVAQIADAITSTSPEMTDLDGKKVLGWIDITLSPPGEMFKKPAFRYVVTTQGAQYKNTDESLRDAIAFISFKDFSSVGCIDGNMLEKYFNRLGVRQNSYHDSGYETIYDVNKGDGFVNRVTAHFNKGEPCLNMLSLTELTK